MLLLLGMGDVAMFAHDLYKHDYSLFAKAWPPLLGLAIVIVAGGGVFLVWLSRMRALFSGAENVDVTASVKKLAGDFLRLFALLALCVIVGLFVAQNLSGY
jgi:predicted exporter